ncbi:MAG: DUF2207 domain-containing protein [bacterium]
MKRNISILFCVAVLFLSCFFNTYAQKNLSYERIDFFNSDIIVNIDSSINVIETIKYNTGGIEKHGVYRDIRLKSFDNKDLKISDISVTDENNVAYKYTESFPSEKISLKIGNPNITFSGEKTYIIKYKIKRAIGYFDNYDEIYWNVTGNDWLFPIEKTSVLVHLPSGANILQSASYCGPSGSKNSCVNIGEGNFSFDNSLSAGDGMTVATGFTKGIIKQPGFWENFLNDFSFTYLFLLLPIFIFIFTFKRWNKYGKDPKSNRTIIAEYDVPDNLTPLEVSGILKEKIDGKAISAEIIYLAINSFLKIEKIEKNIAFIKSDDYLLTKILNTEHSNGADRILMNRLFSSIKSEKSLLKIINFIQITNSNEAEKVNEIKMSSLKNIFYVYIKEITNSIFDKLVSNNYLKNNPQKIKGKYFSLVSVFLFLGLCLMFNFVSEYGLIPIISIIISWVIIFIFGMLMPARTEKGLKTKEYLLGLKEYLNIAEKDRINFHNAPEKKPEIFEKFLPYAMIFGVEKAWAKEFEGIYTEPPKWYSDHNMSVFSAIAFTSSLNNFTTYSNNAISSSPRGSGGGGSSGGGGGGGGGGSW